MSDRLTFKSSHELDMQSVRIDAIVTYYGEPD